MDRNLSQIEERSLLAKALEHLSPRDRVIVHMRFVDGMTQSEIAARVGLSQMQISRILTANIKLLRTIVSEDNHLLDA